MRIVTLTSELLYGKCVRVPAGVRSVWPESAVFQLDKFFRGKKLKPRVSGLGHYSRPYYNQDLTDKTLLAWRGCGIGDAFMFAGILRCLVDRYPTARIIYYMHPTMVAAFKGLDFCEVYHEPIPFEHWEAVDYHLVAEAMCEQDCEPDQGCTWDHQLERVGIDPDSVPPDRKRPPVCVLPEDSDAADAWLLKRQLSGLPLILWQLAPSAVIRAYPPAQTRKALTLLRKAFPDAAIVAVGRKNEQAKYGPLPGGVVACTEPLRSLFALISRAKLIVCPDSCIGHFAAAFPDVPVVSLWGPIAPNDRIKYYLNHTPLTHTTECSPCRDHCQMRCPLKANRGPGFCNAIAGIAPGEILAEAERILKNG